MRACKPAVIRLLLTAPDQSLASALRTVSHRPSIFLCHSERSEESVLPLSLRGLLCKPWQSVTPSVRILRRSAPQNDIPALHFPSPRFSRHTHSENVGDDPQIVPRADEGIGPYNAARCLAEYIVNCQLSIVPTPCPPCERGVARRAGQCPVTIRACKPAVIRLLLTVPDQSLASALRTVSHRPSIFLCHCEASAHTGCGNPFPPVFALCTKKRPLFTERSFPVLPLNPLR